MNQHAQPEEEARVQHAPLQERLQNLISLNASVQDPKNSIYADELLWAHQIKNAIQNHNRSASGDDDESFLLQEVCDFEIAQWGIVTLGKRSMEEIMEGMYKLQCFREQYRLLQSTETDGLLEEGMTLITALVDQHPGGLLSIDYMTEGYYLFIHDYGAFKPHDIVDEDDWKTFSGGLYHIFQLMNSNLHAARSGVSMIAEGMDMGFENYSPKVEERWFHEFNYYPMRHRELLFLHSPLILNLLYACMKPFMSEELRNSIRIGCYLDGCSGRIDCLYKTPSPEVANLLLLERIRSFMLERQFNQATYRLPPSPLPPGSSKTNDISYFIING